ncbi:MAG: PEGA domain-containing protein, partial [Myxococcota bacterium]
ADEPADDALDEARRWMEKGQAHYVAERYDEAAEAFMKAHEARPMPAFLYNAAMAHEKRGEPGKAADLFGRYLSEDPEAADADEVRERIDRLRTAQASRDSGTGIDIVTRTERRTERVERPEASTSTEEGEEEGEGEEEPDPEPPAAEETRPENMKSMLSIQTTPRGARIRVHGPEGVVAEGRSPFFQSLAAGQYDVVVEKDGYREVERPVTVQAGKVYSVIIEMTQGEFSGLLRVTSRPGGATLRVDDPEGSAVGDTPWQGHLGAGEHRLFLERPGYERTEREVTVEAGEETALDVDLERVSFGKLRIVANVRGARVSIDGRAAGEVPFEGRLEAGPHRVRVEAEGKKPWESNIVVAKGQLTPVRVQLEPAVPRGGAWATAVLAGLVLGAGTTLAVMSEDRLDILRDEGRTGRLASNDPRLFRGRMLAIGADTAFGLGGLLALVSVYYFLRDPLPDSEGSVLEPRDWSLDPEVGPNGAGARLRWSF